MHYRRRSSRRLRKTGAQQDSVRVSSASIGRRVAGRTGMTTAIEVKNRSCPAVEIFPARWQSRASLTGSTRWRARMPKPRELVPEGIWSLLVNHVSRRAPREDHRVRYLHPEQRRPSASASDAIPRSDRRGPPRTARPRHWYSRLAPKEVRLALTDSASESRAKLPA
jgi:hypothetical protein